MEQSGNTIIVASKKEPKVFVACVVLATTRLDVNKRVRKLMGVSKASFASAEEMKVITGMGGRRNNSVLASGRTSALC